MDEATNSKAGWLSAFAKASSSCSLVNLIEPNNLLVTMIGTFSERRLSGNSGVAPRRNRKRAQAIKQLPSPCTTQGIPRSDKDAEARRS
jgi:hypothetical protein